MKCKLYLWLIPFCFLFYFLLDHLPRHQPPRSPDTTRIAEQAAGGASGGRGASDPKPIYFPSSLRLLLRAHQRTPIEPLKPLFPNMKEGSQNREIGRKARSQGKRCLICLFWGITQKGSLPLRRSYRVLFVPEKSNAKNKIIFFFISVYAFCVFAYNEATRSTVRAERGKWELKRRTVQRNVQKRCLA